MRFVVTNDWRRNQLLRLVLLFFLLFIVGFCVINALLFFEHMSFSYQGVVDHYLGKAGPWGGAAVPRSYKVMLEVSHGHLFAMAILAMTMTHLALFLPTSPRLKLTLVLSTFLAAVCNEAAGWLIRYLSPAFAYLKLVAFLVLEISLLSIALLLMAAIVGKWRNGYRDGDRNGTDAGTRSDSVVGG